MANSNRSNQKSMMNWNAERTMTKILAVITMITENDFEEIVNVLKKYVLELERRRNTKK